jgi:hypothetical protein
MGEDHIDGMASASITVAPPTSPNNFYVRPANHGKSVGVEDKLANLEAQGHEEMPSLPDNMEEV